MSRERYTSELAGLRRAVLALGGQAEELLRAGLRALVEHDVELADGLDRRDDAIDRATEEVEATCLDLVALQQPVAADMRLVAASYKIVTDIERVGDLAVNLGDYCRSAGRLELVSPREVERVGAIAVAMLGDALAAYADRDAERAEEVIRRDDELDEATWGLIRRFLESLYDSALHEHASGEAERISSQALPVLLSMRDLERVGDHAANICERVVFLVRGRRRPETT